MSKCWHHQQLNLVQQAECSAVLTVQTRKPRLLGLGLSGFMQETGLSFHLDLLCVTLLYPVHGSFLQMRMWAYSSVPHSVVRLCLFVLRCESLTFLLKVRCKVTDLKMTVSASKINRSCLRHLQAYLMRGVRAPGLTS